jgi:WD40 repeat protein
MSRSWQTVRVFISSTFRDMHAERDHLIKFVFPDLRQRIERQRLYLVDIDLRWGVTKEQADNDKVLDLCLDQIDHCRPFFIGILGERYGWVPTELPQFDKPEWGWVQAATGKSVTELEILHGVMRNPAMTGHALFYLRKPDFLAKVPAHLRRSVYEEWPTEEEILGLGAAEGEDRAQNRRTRLDGLKKEIRAYCAATQSPCHDYPCEWDNDKPNLEEDTKGRVTDLEQFGLWVKEELCQAIAREYPQILEPEPEEPKPGSADWQAEEGDYHARFAESRLQTYVPRREIEDRLVSYLNGDSDRPLALVGGSGSGKSAIMSSLWQNHLAARADLVVLPHFVGASPSSTNVAAFLRRACLVLCEQFNISQTVKSAEGREETRPYEVPSDPRELPDAFREVLGKTPTDKRVVIVMDAVNQLDEYDDAHELRWLPDTLPLQVKMVVSCIEETGKEIKALQSLRRRQVPELRADPLADDQRREIIRRIPSVSAKTLDETQIALLAQNEATRNPLFLSVALEELRGFGSFERLNAKIGSFPRAAGEEGLNKLFRQILERLTTDLDATTVRQALCLLACSRMGLSEGELTELLDRLEETAKGQLSLRPAAEQPESRLPTAAASTKAGTLQLMLRQLRPYLMRRGASVDFYHRNLFTAVRAHWLFAQDAAVPWHGVLAQYFEGLGLKSPRMLTETVHHQREGELWDDLARILCDLSFIEAKCAAGMTYRLAGDYAQALAAFPEAKEDRKKEQVHQERVARYSREMIEYAAKWNTIHARNLIVRLLLGRKKVPLPEIIASVPLRKEAELDKEIARIAGHPERLDRVRSFAAFVLSESYLLVRHGAQAGFCVQQAYNHAVEGPVAQVAETTVQSRPGQELILRFSATRPSLNPYPSCLRTLDGHTDYVQAVALTSDGRRAVSGSHLTLSVWDVETGRCLRTLEGHTDSVHGVAMTPDGRRAVSGSFYCLRRQSEPLEPLRVWDLETGRCLRTLEGHTEGVCSVALTPDGRRAVSGGKDGTLRVWDVESGECLRTLKCLSTIEWRPNSVNTVALTPDGCRAVVGCSDYTLRVWDVEAGKCLRTLEGHTNSVNTVALTPDGRRAVSGSEDKTGSSNNTLRVWDVESGECLHMLTGSVSAVALTPDGCLAVSGGWDKTLRVWELETGRCLRTLEGHTEGVCAVALTPDGRRAVSGGKDGTLRVWDVEMGRCMRMP